MNRCSCMSYDRIRRPRAPILISKDTPKLIPAVSQWPLYNFRARAPRSAVKE